MMNKNKNQPVARLWGRKTFALAFVALPTAIEALAHNITTLAIMRDYIPSWLWIGLVVLAGVGYFTAALDDKRMEAERVEQN